MNGCRCCCGHAPRGFEEGCEEGNEEQEVILHVRCMKIYELYLENKVHDASVAPNGCAYTRSWVLMMIKSDFHEVKCG